MTRGKILDRLVERSPAVFASYDLTPSRCVLATAVGIDVLRRFGIDAAPLSVYVQLANPAMVAWYRDGQPGGEDEGMRRGCWILIGGDPDLFADVPLKPGTWDGHVVIELPGEVIDLDLQQMNRPEHDIAVQPAGRFAFHDDGPCAYDLVGGCHLTIEARRADTSFMQKKDWVADRQPLVEDIYRAIRKG